MKNENILQIDVEDWFCDLDISQWDKQETRIVNAIDKLLTILKETNNTATFFILGYFAEKFPNIVKKIRKDGHEIGTHGYSHKRITNQTPEEFEKDVLQSIIILQGITKERVKGYRAPYFTVVKETLWAIDILKKLGLEYDSSIFPVNTPMYGIPDYPNLYPHRLSNSLIEVPLSIYKFPFFKKRFPIAGGFYLRALPYFFIKYALNKINKSNNVAVCYIHPWELDTGFPRIDGLKWFNYYNLKPTEKKFRKLLTDFDFISTEKFIERMYGKDATRFGG